MRRRTVIRSRTRKDVERLQTRCVERQTVDFVNNFTGLLHLTCLPSSTMMQAPYNKAERGWLEHMRDY
jgi:hypothetical protein